jgi:hypothetical protein
MCIDECVMMGVQGVAVFSQVQRVIDGDMLHCCRVIEQ